MSKKTRTEYSILNVATGIGGYAINTIIGLICRMVFTRTLAADYLGINGLFTNILTVLSLAELGIGSAIVYALYKPLATDDKEKIASLVKFYGQCYRIIGIVVAVIGTAFIPFLNFIIHDPPNIDDNLYVIYCLYLFNTASTYFFSYRSALLQAAQKSYLVTGISYIVTIVESVIQIVVLLTTHNYMVYLIILIVGTFLYNIIISLVAKKEYPYIADKNIKPLSKGEKKSLFKNVKNLIVIKIAGMLVNHSDNLIITYFNGLISVGYASNYTLLISTLNSLLNQIFLGINASVGNHNALEKVEKRYALFNCINLANFWLFGWAAIGMTVCSSDIVTVLFGEGYKLSIAIPFALALNFYIVGMQNAVWTYKNTLGLFKYGRYLLFFTAGINIVLSIWLGQKWGLFGVYLATSIARLLTNAWYDPYAVFKYGLQQKFSKYLTKYIFYFILLFTVGSLCYWICQQFAFSNFINMILKLLVCTIVPNLIFFAVFFKTDEFRYLKQIALRFLNKFIKKIKRQTGTK